MKDYISNGFKDPKGAYCTIRYDRCNTRGDGVCELISKAYTVNEVKMNDCYADLEVCCFDVLFQISSTVIENDTETLE